MVSEKEFIESSLSSISGRNKKEEDLFMEHKGSPLGDAIDAKKESKRVDENRPAE